MKNPESEINIQQILSRSIGRAGASIPDKDEASEELGRFISVAREAGITGRSLRTLVGTFEERIYNGTPREQCQAAERLGQAREGLSNAAQRQTGNKSDR